MVQGIDLFFSLFNNLAIFIALVVLYRYLVLQFKKTRWYRRQIVLGLSFGVFAVAVMYARIPVYEGVIVDQRNAIVALSGAFGGPLSAVLSAALAASFRAYLGGAGVVSGIFGLGLAAVAGVILNRFRTCFSTARNGALSALFATVLILPGFLIVGDLHTGWQLLVDMSIPYGSALFVGIFLAGLLLQREEARYEVEQAFRESEEKYRILFQSFPLGITISDKAGHIVESNDVATRLAGPWKAEHGGGSIDEQDWRVLRSDGKEMPVEEFPGVKALEMGRQVDNVEMGIAKSDDDVLWLNVTAAPIPLERYGVAITYTDISERKAAEEELKRALEERTVLIQELYHRTKNNMQIVNALLEWYAQDETDERIVSILRKTRNRIHSMALVHEHLYQSQSLSKVNLEPYVRELADSVMRSFDVSPDRVGLRWDTKSVWTLIDSAIPFGLIVEELLSNALEHGFQGGETGEITISLARRENGEVFFYIADNGVGLPDGFEPRVHGGQGLQTILALGEEQLQGRVEIENADGTSCNLRFRDDLYEERI